MNVSLNSQDLRSWASDPKTQLSKSEGDVLLERLHNAPETLTNEQLSIIPLRILSKGLGNLSSRRIIDAYLRWLEVQRLSPRRNINYNWGNTVSQWTQALRARRFTIEEVLHEVELWRNTNGPFHDPQIEGGPRYPPEPSDLVRGWKQVLQGATSAKKMQAAAMGYDHYAPSKPMGYSSRVETNVNKSNQVPPSYICNRCEGRGMSDLRIDHLEIVTDSLIGHYVVNCPTNEDPSFDKPPSLDYRCRFCQQPGSHYWMFCPRNPDPNSIYRRRQAKQRDSYQETTDKEMTDGRLSITSKSSRETFNDQSPPTPFPFPTYPFRIRENADHELAVEADPGEGSLAVHQSKRSMSTDTTDIDRLKTTMSDVAMMNRYENTVAASELLNTVGKRDLFERGNSLKRERSYSATSDGAWLQDRYNGT